MNNAPTLEELLEVQEWFGLPSPVLVEKDWYVVQALAAIINANLEPFRLVFGGGTALGRANKLIYRMSEDIDLKIISEEVPKRSVLRKLRSNITKALLDTGFVFDPENSEHRQSRNESRYTIYRLPYNPITNGTGVLRPEIQIETAVWPLRYPSVELAVSSFIREAYQQPAEIEKIACVSVTQTAAEKFVALTRRIAVEIADARGPRDSTLVRHIYDLHMIRSHYDISEMIKLIQEIMNQDAREFGNQFPAYRDDPITETFRAIDAITNNLLYKERYRIFLRDMVYGDTIKYSECVNTLNSIAEQLLS